MTYEEALAFWYRRTNYEVRAAQPDDLKLDRMRGLLRYLGDPQRLERAVHVAGSKGKGSTAAMLAAVLRQAGYRTGLFTSPHLSRVEERIQLDGVTIKPGELASLMAEIRAAVEAYEAKNPGESEAPTFFEIVTAPAPAVSPPGRSRRARVGLGSAGPPAWLPARYNHRHRCDRQLAARWSGSGEGGHRRPGVNVSSGVQGRRRDIEAVALAERARWQNSSRFTPCTSGVPAAGAAARTGDHAGARLAGSGGRPDR